MNFTREPIIETIVTPREGSKLLVRSSKRGSNEEFSVDALEIVSFGQALFFRSLEKPRPFLVPVSDYEVMEAKESREVLKSASYEKNIKIGGGREASLRKEEEPLSPLEGELSTATSSSGKGVRKQRERHRRRRRVHEEKEHRLENDSVPNRSSDSLTKEEIPQTSPPPLTTLIPPPPNLISDIIHKYKERQQDDTVPFSRGDQGDSNQVSKTFLPEENSLSTQVSFLNNWHHFLP